MAGDATVEVLDDTVIEVDLDTTLDDGGAPAKPNGSAARAAQDAVSEAAESLANAKAAAEERARNADATAQAERNARIAAEQRAGGAEAEVDRLRETAENQELTLITNGIDSATRAVEAAKAEFATAMDAGEFAKAGDAQEKMSKAAAALDRLETQKVQYESGARRTAPATTEGRVVAPTDPKEQYLAQFRNQPESLAWLRAHPECLPPGFGGSAVKNAQMMKGHREALEAGFEPNTPDYFRVIEETAGYRSPMSAAAATEVTPRTPTPPRRPATPAAPVSRDPPEGAAVTAGTNPRTVRLTPAQQEVALFSYPADRTESEAAHRKRAFGTYANELVKATAEGKIGRLTH